MYVSGGHYAEAEFCGGAVPISPDTIYFSDFN
jgi:hypothetical protein